MAKKFISTDRFVKGDPLFNDKVVSKFINYIMWNGKKTLAQKIFYNALERLKKNVTKEEPLQVFKKALENVKPEIEVRSKRVGGQTYQVPIEVGKKRRTSLAMRWIIAAVRSKKGEPAEKKLADELLNAYNNEGDAITVKLNVHRMAEANKAFSHFAW